MTCAWSEECISKCARYLILLNFTGVTFGLNVQLDLSRKATTKSLGSL